MAEINEHDAMGCRACGREERASEGYPCANCGTFICLICTFRGVTSLPRMRRPGAARREPPLIARAAIVPLMASRRSAPSRSSQLVLGETAGVLESAGRVAADRVTDSTATRGGSTPAIASRSWTPPRRCRRGPGDAAAGATAPRCGSATAQCGCRSALASRSTARASATRRTPRARCVEGAVTAGGPGHAAARAKAPERWALEHFAGAPYEWGGVTPCGVDCSGADADHLPGARRHSCRATPSHAGRSAGPPCRRTPSAPAICSSSAAESSDRIVHVAFAGEADTLVHSTISLGGMVQEPWLPGSRARRRSASDWSPCGGWRSGDAEAGPLRYRRHASCSPPAPAAAPSSPR